LPEDSSPAAQADLYASLLDTLGIRKVALVGTSAGTASSFQFALRHPERCTALVLWSMAVPPHAFPSHPVRFALRSFFGSDFLLWAFVTYFPAGMFKQMGVPRLVQRRLTPDQRQWLQNAMATFLPTSQRIQGIMNDVCLTNPGVNDPSPFEPISIPKLIIHAVDDPMPAFETAKAIARRLQNARFIKINSGGHLLLGHFDQVRAEMSAFIRQHAV
jgi:pimeloyl-ACP methyl ester carboxylesterase